MAKIRVMNAKLLPSCVDHQGHRFVLNATADMAVCERCGLIRADTVTIP